MTVVGSQADVTCGMLWSWWRVTGVPGFGHAFTMSGGNSQAFTLGYRTSFLHRHDRWDVATWQIPVSVLWSSPLFWWRNFDLLSKMHLRMIHQLYLSLICLKKTMTIVWTGLTVHRPLIRWLPPASSDWLTPGQFQTFVCKICACSYIRRQMSDERWWDLCLERWWDLCF
jgi:hypothetical protein